MRGFVFRCVTCMVLLQATLAYGTPASPFSFGVIAKQLKATTGEATVRNAIAESDADNLAFVVASGVKAVDEPCTDTVYKNRRALLDSAKNGLIVSITASDWAQCVNVKNRSIASERMNRLRDLFFTDEFSLGDSKIPLIRQSTMPQFRMYGENMRWRINDVMFATINLPSNNNNYLNAAGRNSEFEDRQIANTDWLKRLFLTAKIGKLDGIVLFCDGNPFVPAEHSSFFSSGNKREGYANIRRQIMTFAAKFQGRILIVHSDQDAHQISAPRNIDWHGNIGTFRADTPWRKISVDAALPQLFSATNPALSAQTAHR